MIKTVRYDRQWDWKHEHSDKGTYEIYHGIVADSNTVALIGGVMIDKSKMSQFHKAIPEHRDCLPYIGNKLFTETGWPTTSRLHGFLRDLGVYTFDNTGRFVYIHEVQIKNERVNLQNCDNKTFEILRYGILLLLQNQWTMCSKCDCALYVFQNERDQQLLESIGFKQYSDQSSNLNNLMFASTASLLGAHRLPKVLPAGWETVWEHGDLLAIMNQKDATIFVESELEYMGSDISPEFCLEEDSEYVRKPDGSIFIRRYHQEFLLKKKDNVQKPYQQPYNLLHFYDIERKDTTKTKDICWSNGKKFEVLRTFLH